MNATETAYTGKNYRIDCDGAFCVLITDAKDDERFDSFDELVEAHPTCEEARQEIFGKVVFEIVERTNGYTIWKWLSPCGSYVLYDWRFDRDGEPVEPKSGRGFTNLRDARKEARQLKEIAAQ